MTDDEFREYLRERARRNVETWPPFTPEQRARLTVLLSPDRPAAADRH